MLVSFKDALKQVGVSVVCFCAAFVCTFFLNFYLDVLPLENEVPEQIKPLYEAQLATAQMCCSITGGVLSLVALVMIVFYIKLYVDEHGKELGTLKAMGMNRTALAKSFCIFGAGVFAGCLLGYGIGHAIMPFVYKSLTIDGLNVKITFHGELIAYIVIIPTAVSALFSFAYAAVTLRQPPLKMIRGYRAVKVKADKNNGKDRPFISQMRISVIKSRKMLTFFVAFSCFCFAAMVQMGISMEDLVDGTMGWMILIIGLVLALTSAFMAMTSLVKNNSQNIAMMKTMGYSLKDCVDAVFVGYIPFCFAGFILGTLYQYGLLQLMVNLIFKNVGDVPEYGFDFKAMLITLALFIVFYTAVAAVYVKKLNKISVKTVMSEI